MVALRCRARPRMLTCLYLLWQVHFSNTPDSQIELTDRGYAQAAAAF